MKFGLLTLAFILGLTVSAWARLGETEQQLTARYGGVISQRHINADESGNLVAVDQLQFKKNGFNIWVSLFNDVSADEDIQKASNDPLTRAEVKTLLDANSENHTWTEVPSRQWPEDNGAMSFENVVWQREDGARATVINGKSFRIKSKELIAAEQAAYKAAHATSLEGF